MAQPTKLVGKEANFGNSSVATQFQPGHTHGFPKGVQGRESRPPKWKTLITSVLKEKLSRLGGSLTERKTFAELLSDRLVQCALKPKPDEDKTVIMAITEIIDRTEGKARQQIDVNDVTEQQVAQRTDADLEFFIAHGHWPEDKVSRQ